jgi:hypothetical protein
MAFKAITNCSGTMQERAKGEAFMAVGAESVFRNHETGVGILVMAIVTALIDKGRVFGGLYNLFLLLLRICQFFLGRLNVVVPAVLLSRRQSGDTVENSAGDFMHRQRVACTDKQGAGCQQEYDGSSNFQVGPA